MHDLNIWMLWLGVIGAVVTAEVMTLREIKHQSGRLQEKLAILQMEVIQCEKDNKAQLAKLISSFELGMQDALQQIGQMKQRAEHAEIQLIKDKRAEKKEWKPEDIERELAGRF